jgi:DNA (cytosine-5)-methyltransferase 1
MDAMKNVSSAARPRSPITPPDKSGLTVIDLFSGAGGMSLGFRAHPAFRMTAAFDGEFGNPSSGAGSLGCNGTYEANIGITPMSVDLSKTSDNFIEGVRDSILAGRDLDVLLACPPCTGFSRTNPDNHMRDDSRNSLVRGVARWVSILRPSVVVMENARELLRGNQTHHFTKLRADLEGMGYAVSAGIHMLDAFGLPQRRERALVVAALRPLAPRALDDLWDG